MNVYTAQDLLPKTYLESFGVSLPARELPLQSLCVSVPLRWMPLSTDGLLESRWLHLVGGPHSPRDASEPTGLGEGEELHKLRIPELPMSEEFGGMFTWSSRLKALYFCASLLQLFNWRFIYFHIFMFYTNVLNILVLLVHLNTMPRLPSYSTINLRFVIFFQFNFFILFKSSCR
jgi:hypothetical protein